MPLAYGCLLGGLTTLIGTPPNLLIANSLQQAGEPSFGLFDFTPIGGGVLIAGTLFIALLGRHMLPSVNARGRNPEAQSAPSQNPVRPAHPGIRDAGAPRFHPGRQDPGAEPHRRCRGADRHGPRARQQDRTHALAPDRAAGRRQARGPGTAGPFPRVSALERAHHRTGSAGAAGAQWKARSS